MRRLFLVLSLIVISALACAEILATYHTPAGIVQIDNGTIVVNGEKLFVVRQYDGKKISLDSEHILFSAGQNPGLFLSTYHDKAASTTRLRTQHLIITDATGPKVRLSNVLDTGIDFSWGDNNYVRFEDGAMYFGIYNRYCYENNCQTQEVPHRMQFVYRDGKLEENTGPWRGPAKPEIYLQPTGDDPCWNVNGVEDCREEIEREKAAKRARQKRKATQPAAAK